ncbi:hypothetical protein GCM10020331_018570 [Ectobacillus funiculus]
MEQQLHIVILMKNKHYMGGAITPGIMISAEALYTRAAKLPRIEITRPQDVIGKKIQ